MDRILIEDLRLRCIIGVNDDERHEKQDVIVSLCLWMDLRRPCRTDDIADTLDYKALKMDIRETVEESAFFLLERLADEVAGICLRRPRVERVRVRVDKPGALRFARTVAVEVDRGRESTDDAQPISNP